MKNKARIAYFGSDPICLPALRFLIGEGAETCELACIVSQPDRRSGRGKHLQQNPVSAFAHREGIPLLQPERLDAAFAARLGAEELTLAFVMAYGHFLPKSVRQAPVRGMLNFHGSILPAYRGASPVETAVAMGETETGVCLMKIVREMDAGPVAGCERVSIEKTDTGPVVRGKIGEAVVPLLRRNLAAAISGELPFHEQAHAGATFCRKIRKEDGALDFEQEIAVIDARLRAFFPWPGAYFDHGPVRIKVGAAEGVSGETGVAPGTVLAAVGTLNIAVAGGVLAVRELQRPGGRMLPASEFLKGYAIQPGTVLPSVSNEQLLVSRPV